MRPYTLEFGVDPDCIPPESLWLAIEAFLPDPKSRPKGGRPPMPSRTAFFATFYLMRTCCQWRAIPRSLGVGSAVHDRFQDSQKAGIFSELCTTELFKYNTDIGLDFEWESLDRCITKAPLGGGRRGSGQKGHRTTPSHRSGRDPNRSDRNWSESA